MGLAAPSYTRQRLSKHFCLMGECQPGYIHRHQSIHSVLLGFLALKGLKSSKLVYLMQDVTHCTCPYHPSHPLQRAAVKALISGVVSPRVFHLGCSCSWSSLFSPHILLEWGKANWTQAFYTLPSTLGERCLEVSTGNRFLNFPETVQHLVAMALSKPPPKHSMSPT